MTLLRQVQARVQAVWREPRLRFFVVATLVAGVARLSLGKIAGIEVADRADGSLQKLDGLSAGLVPVALPTLGEWGMLAATLSLLAAGTTIILRRRSR